jgi:hypothetical protein
MPGLGKKTFTAGDVLIAGDVNNYLMDQTVMNFASSAARSSAIPVPTEGMTTYVQDRNQIETFDGAEYRGMSGLQLVKKQTIGPAVSSITVTDAFNSTYDNYKILVTGGAGSTAPIYFNLRFDSITTGYYGSLIYSPFASNATPASIGTNNGANLPYTGFSNIFGLSAEINLVNVSATKPTRISAPFYDNVNSGFASGLCDSLVAHTSFTLLCNTGNVTGGTIYVYGYGT